MDIVIERSNDLLNYTMVDGNSDRQGNGRDCGVFTLMNIERAVTNMQTPVTQDLMSLYRCKILLKLLNRANLKGLVTLPRAPRLRQITTG